jgi:hypothetical protein
VDILFVPKGLVCSLVIIVGVLALMLPLLRYVVVGWQIKRRDIMDGFNEAAKRTYFQMFVPSESVATVADATKEFERIYRKWYGRQFFFLPGVLLFVVTVMVVSMIAFSGFSRFAYIKNPVFDLPNTALAALAGAYLWVVHDFISRSRRLDFSSSDVHWATLRFLIAIPMGYAFSATPATGPFVAFALGTFPLSALVSGLRRMAEKNVVALAPTKEESQDEIAKLQGVNKAVVDRLANEDIATVNQLAYCDPVRLVMRSNLTFNFVTDCMNQALAWIYLGEHLNTLRPMGLRGAVEIKNLIDEYDDSGSTDPKAVEVHQLATRAVPKMAAAIKQDPDTFLIVLREIAGDPFTRFLAAMWEQTG